MMGVTLLKHQTGSILPPDVHADVPDIRLCFTADSIVQACHRGLQISASLGMCTVFDTQSILETSSELDTHYATVVLQQRRSPDRVLIHCTAKVACGDVRGPAPMQLLHLVHAA